MVSFNLYPYFCIFVISVICHIGIIRHILAYFCIFKKQILTELIWSNYQEIIEINCKTITSIRFDALLTIQHTERLKSHVQKCVNFESCRPNTTKKRTFSDVFNSILFINASICYFSDFWSICRACIFRHLPLEFTGWTIFVPTLVSLLAKCPSLPLIELQKLL